MWCLVLLLLPAPAATQDFGQNKVQYQQFDFKVMRNEHFDIRPLDRPAKGWMFGIQPARGTEEWTPRTRAFLSRSPAAPGRGPTPGAVMRFLADRDADGLRRRTPQRLSR